MAPADAPGGGAGRSSGQRATGGGPRTVRTVSLNRLYRELLRGQDLGFEASGELVNAANQLAAVARLEEQRRVLEQRGRELLCGTCRRQAGTCFLAAQARAAEQRLALIEAGDQFGRAAGFVRALNGVIEGGRAWLSTFLPGRGGEKGG